MEDLLKRVKILRERAATSQGEVRNGKLDKVYVWVHKSDQRLVYFEGFGYQICRDPSVQTNWRKEDGTHVWGDAILLEIDKDFHEALKLESQARSVEALEGTRESFIAFAQTNGIPVRDNSQEV